MFTALRRKSCTALVAAGLVLLGIWSAGCGTLPRKTTDVEYYEACYAPIQELRNQQESLKMATASGVFLGALGGMLVGYLSTGKLEGALVGLGAGALAGGLAGYAMERNKQIQSDAMRYISYQADINEDTSKLDRTLVAAGGAQKCYDQEFQQLLGLMRDKAISKDEARKRFTEIQDGSAEAAAILGSISDAANGRVEQYQEALKYEAAKASVGVDEIMVALPKEKDATLSSSTEFTNSNLDGKGELVAMGRASGRLQEKQAELKVAKTNMEETIADYSKKFDILLSGI
ncbi:MAG: hypothetical protein KQJ78_14605 [Deltaproteobacteria bacterium]|nr:hypothetical protein [Deltaproteobacteria bacterium]